MADEDERGLQSIQRCDTFLLEQKSPGTAIRAAARRLAVVRAAQALKVPHLTDSAATDELRKQSAFAHTARHERSDLLRAIKPRLTRGRPQIEPLKLLPEPFLNERLEQRRQKREPLKLTRRAKRLQKAEAPKQGLP